MKSRIRLRSTSRNLNRNSYDALEPRQLLATIAGTESADVFEITATEILVNGQKYEGPLDTDKLNQVDGLGGNDLFLIHSTTRKLEYFGSGGNDRFEVSDREVTEGELIILIDAGEGDENQLIVSRSAKVLEAKGETEVIFIDTEDSHIQRLVDRVVGATIADVKFTSTSGHFSYLEINGTRDFLSGNSDFSDIVWLANDFDPATQININALSGDDGLVVANDYDDANPTAPSGHIRLDAGEGADRVRVSYSSDLTRQTHWNVSVLDGDGAQYQDQLEIEFETPDDQNVLRIDGGLDHEGFVTWDNLGSLGFGKLSFDPDFYELRVRSENYGTRFELMDSPTDKLWVLGHGDASDHFLVYPGVFESLRLTGEGSDRLDIFGTDGPDEILSNGKFVTVNGVRFEVTVSSRMTINGLGGDDRFVLNDFKNRFSMDGGQGNDEFHLNGDQFSGFGRGNWIRIEGGEGKNRIVATRQFNAPGAIEVRADRLLNVLRADVYYSSYGGQFQGADGSPGIEIISGDVLQPKEEFRVYAVARQNSIRIQSNIGDDVFRINPGVDGDASFDGQGGDDRYIVMADALDSNVSISDTGESSNDRILTYLSPLNDWFRLSPNQLYINIGFGTTRRLNFDPNGIDAINVFGMGGEDRFDIESVPVRLSAYGGSGNDEFNVSEVRGSNLLQLFGNGGLDHFNLTRALSTLTVNANGGPGIDHFQVSGGFKALTRMNGGLGNDLFVIDESPTITKSDRRISVVDSADEFGDWVVYRMSNSSETRSVTIRSFGILVPRQQLFLQGIDRLIVKGTSLDDTVSVFGTPANSMKVELLGGQDFAQVNGGAGGAQFVMSTGEGDDIVNVLGVDPSVEADIQTDEGNDLVFVGSTLSANNGNLNRIQGGLNINLGSGVQDRLHVNDALADQKYGYSLFPHLLRNRNGISERADFHEITFQNHEFFQLATSRDHHATVGAVPSRATRYLLDGSSTKLNTLFVIGEEPSDIIRDGPRAGIVIFDNGFRDIVFEDFVI